MKKKIVFKKILIILIACILLFLLFLLFRRLWRKADIQKQLDLANTYLDSTDYDSAILAFEAALEIEPANLDAIQGLAEAYHGNGDSDFALELLSQTGDAGKNVAMQELEADIYEKKDELDKVLSILENLIQQTDEDIYYEKRDEILRRYLEREHAYSAGPFHEAVILSNLQTRGSNIMGQLGTEPGISQWDYYQNGFADAEFPGQAQKVYCVGQDTYVVDSNDNLWAAGANRSGQQAQGGSSVRAESGWHQIEGISDVAKISGGTSYVLILKKDGTLWYAGQNYGLAEKSAAWCPEPVQISNMGLIQDIGSNAAYCAVLTTSGTLYLAPHTGNPAYTEGWKILGRDVREFSISDNGIFWLTQAGEISSSSYNLDIMLPAEWERSSFTNYLSVTPEKEILHMAACDDGILLLSADGELCLYQQTGSEVIQTPAEVRVLYTEGTRLVAEYSDGTIQVFISDGENMIMES